MVIPATNRIWRTEAPGGMEATTLTEVPLEPRPSPKHVLMLVHAIGLNPADAFQIEGKYPGGPKPPFIAGRDAAGIVLESDSRGAFAAGDRVVVLQTASTDLSRGFLADMQWVLAENLAPLPDGWTMAEGAATPLAAMTAWKGLVDKAKVQPSEAVVVIGASGGVGLFAVQIAKAIGATVVALTRSARRREELIEAGAAAVLDTESADLKKEIFQAIQRRGVNVVIDTVGGKYLGESVHWLAAGGRVCAIGVLAGVETTVPIPALMFKQASLHGVLVTEDSAEEASASWSQLIRLFRGRNLKPHIDRLFVFEEGHQAFAYLRGGVFGKVVVQRQPETARGEAATLGQR